MPPMPIDDVDCGLLEDTALQMAKPPCNLAVIVAFILSIVGNGGRRLTRAHTCGKIGRIAVTFTAACQRNRRHRQRRTIDLNEPAARREVSLQMRAHDIGAVRNVAERKSPVGIGHREYRGRSERGNNDAFKGAAAVVEHNP